MKIRHLHEHDRQYRVFLYVFYACAIIMTTITIYGTVSMIQEWQENGTYVISANFDGKKLGHIYMQIVDFDINWLKISTQEWIDGEISSYQYENRINQVIQLGVFEINPIKQDSLPDWMKMNAEKWIDGEINQKEYFDIVKFIAS